MREDKERRDIKRMADMLRRGATLTDRICPACASPIFRLRGGDLWCAKCEKKVVVMKEGEEGASARSDMVLDKVEETLLSKIQKIQEKMEHEEDPEELQKLGSSLSGFLENLERIRKTKKH